jgi:hypothetical protein
VKRFGSLGIALVILLSVSACSSGKKIGGGLTTSTSASSQTTSDICKTTTLTATEVGVNPTTITVSVIADTGSSLRPGLFQGSVDAVNAWADYINANGGLACRQIVVKALDSKLSGDDAKNAMTTACGDSLAMVGTTAVFLTDMSPAEQCKDKSGKPTGIADFAVLQTSSEQQCSPVSWPALESSGSCPYSGEGVRSTPVSTTAIDYYLDKYGKNALHGVYLVPKDLPSTIASTTPIYAAQKQEGIKEDAEFGVSAGDTQSGYTPFVQAIKTHKSTFARDGADYVSYVFFRKEAQVQGIDTVKVWDCSLQCYDQRLISSGGPAVEGQYVWLSFLPFEDQGHNDELDAFLQYDKKPDAFGAQAWVAGEIFAEAVNSIVAKDGPNGLTRQAVLDAVANIHDFDAGGFISPSDIGSRVGSKCLIGMQVQNGKFVRVDPVEPGTFDCRGRVITVTLDPVKAYKG